MHKIIKRAMLHTVTDIGQLTAEETRELNKAVKKGWLSKGKGGTYPILKTVYALPGFDFAADRRREVDYMMYLDSLDRVAAQARVVHFLENSAK